MAVIKYDNYVFSVNVQQTKEYYQNNSVCECDYCQYLHSNIQGKYPELEVFLANFGIDITKFDEAGPVELDGQYLYSFIGYTVCGKIVNISEQDIVLPGTDDIRIRVDTGYAFPNNQDSDYFSLTVFGVSLDCETAKESRTESLAESLRLKIKSLLGKRT